MTFDELVAGVLEQGGFDVTPAMAGGWVNEVHRKAVAESQWMQQRLSLGATVAGQSEYAVPDNVVDIVSLYVAGPQGEPGHWSRIGATDMWDVRSGRLALRGSGGVFAPAFGPAGEKRVEVWPAPKVAGRDIVALAAVSPPTLAAAQVPVVPEDMHGDLMDGAIALGLLRMDERADSAAAFDAKFQRMVSLLRRRKNSRVGSQPSRIQVKGHDF